MTKYMVIANFVENNLDNAEVIQKTNEFIKDERCFRVTKIPINDGSIDVLNSTIIFER